MAEFSLADFAAKLLSIADETEHHAQAGIEKGLEIGLKESQDEIGHYQLGWPQLKPATQEDRARKGFTPNDPLLRSGEMRASLEKNAGHLEGRWGSNSDIAVYQELGTAKIPPRSFLAGAAMRKGPEIAAAVVAETFKGFKP